MNETFVSPHMDSPSDNQKYKIKNPNWLGLSVTAFLLVAAGAAAHAQQPTGKISRIGYLSGIGDPNSPGPDIEAFRKGLRDLGYIDGKNILVEYRYSEGKNDRMQSFVTELLQLKVDVIVSGVGPAISAAKQATKTIPIVMVTAADPVAMGYVDSLARPGGNITGLTRLTRELSGKRLELLKDVVPGISRVGILWSTTDGLQTNFQYYEAAARALKIPIQSLEVRAPKPDFEGAFEAAAKGRVNALITVTTSLLTRHAKQIGDLAIKNRRPLMSEGSHYVEAGALLSYSANDSELYRRATIYIDKILKGTKPADIPVEQPTKFEFVINLQTAKALNLTIPQSVLFRADKVIK
jgi:putative ABC transport system substrate-binding protein